MTTRKEMGVALAAMVSVLFLVPTVASGDPPEKVEICHYNVDSDPGVPDWQLLEVNQQAVKRHLDHGDGYPGNYVPGSGELLRFDEACVPYPVETIFAVAYGDMVPGDGDFNPDEDVLVAKLVDGSPFDGVPGPGDEILMGGFPTSLFADEPTEFGSFTLTSHVTDSATFSADYGIVAFDGSVEYRWLETGDFEEFRENTYSTVLLDYLVVSHEEDQDAVYINPNGPSQPDTSYIGNRFSWPGDQVFVDIDIYYTP